MPTHSDDVIRGLFNGGAISALGGNDHIHWSERDGSATLYAGDLNESYDPNPYNTGNPGGDRLYLSGTVGANIRFGTTENGTVLMGDQALNFFGVERLHGTEGNDTISASTALMNPYHGNTPEHGISIYAGAGADLITGSKADDVLDGGMGHDTISGGAGNDFIQSSTGNDRIQGGDGNENIRWGLGDNVAPGNDTIYGGNTQEDNGDLINIWSVDGGQEDGRGAQVTFINARGGFATSTMGDVTSKLIFRGFENGWTHQGQDTVTGANALIEADGRGIRFNTRWGDDVIVGSQGNDTLEGGEDRDTITGGRGDDLISANGEYYNSYAPGDGDADTLIFRRGDGHDTVLGFDVGVDVLQLDGRWYSAQETHNGTLLDLGNGDTVLLSNVFDFI